MSEIPDKSMTPLRNYFYVELLSQENKGTLGSLMILN